ncbi:hypothetical protein MBLNU13_g11181t1 [Cladosporium sp. NU13]
MASRADHVPMGIDPSESTLALRPHPQKKHQERQASTWDVKLQQATMDSNHPTLTIPVRPHPRTKGQKRPVASSGQKYAQDAIMSGMNIDRMAPTSTLTTPGLHGFSKPRTSQQSGFFDLTDETKVRILPVLPARTVVSRCRATCQELCALIDGYESQIAQTIAKRELLRLQGHSDKLEAFGPPANIIGFVEGLRFFTAQRGNPAGHEERWGVLARDFLQLQRSYDDDVRWALLKRDYRQKFTHICRDWDYIPSHQIMEVYELVESSPANQPYFPGTFYAPQVLERDTWPELRLTMAYNGSQCLHPVVPYELVHLLGLPKLPQNKGFFYYVEEQWACKEIEQGPLCPMLMAAVLQLIKIF